jgi:DNA-directed RNA polymerase subunit RPC12/RpoP
MNAMNTVRTYLKFNCIYCGQHMECDPRFSGRQILCPGCLHRIVIPTPRGGTPVRQALFATQTWDTHVPLPSVEIPTRHRRGIAPNPMLAQAA